MIPDPLKRAQLNIDELLQRLENPHGEITFFFYREHTGHVTLGMYTDGEEHSVKAADEEEFQTLRRQGFIEWPDGYGWNDEEAVRYGINFQVKWEDVLKC